MTARHPDLPEEQAFIDHAYDCLENSRQAAWRLRDLNEADLGGTFQARFERNAFDEALVKRLTDLDLGDVALVFGRIDRNDEQEGTESFRIGRLAVADDQSEPVVIDWRAPVAEPFTGRPAASRWDCSAAGTSWWRVAPCSDSRTNSLVRDTSDSVTTMASTAISAPRPTAEGPRSGVTRP